MQKVEARKWISHKEIFDQYAIDKLALMHSMNLSDEDSIQLLAGGIQQNSLRATTLSVATNTLDVFLEKMRHITQEVNETEKRGSSANGPQKTKDAACKNCGKKGHHHKECRAEATCFYCKEKGHRRFDCPILKKKATRSTPAGQNFTAATAANVEATDSATATTVAIVNESGVRLELSSPFVKVGEMRCNLLALVDTGRSCLLRQGRRFIESYKNTDYYCI